MNKFTNNIKYWESEENFVNSNYYKVRRQRILNDNKKTDLRTQFLKNRGSKFETSTPKQNTTPDIVRKHRIAEILGSKPFEDTDIKITKRRLLRFTSCIDRVSSSGYASSAYDTPKDSQDDFETMNSTLESCRITPIKPKKIDSIITDSSKNLVTSRTKSIGNLSERLHQESIWERYCKILPNAKRLMETKLSEFLSQYRLTNLTRLNIDPCEKFAAQQIIEIVRSVYIKSLSFQHHFTSKYLFDLNTRIEELLNEATLKSAKEMKCVYEMAQKFNFIISDTARILYCIETNPTKFVNSGKETDDYLKILNKDMDLTSYIKKALGEPVKDQSGKKDLSPQIIVKTNRYLPSISLKIPPKLPHKNSRDKNIDKDIKVTPPSLSKPSSEFIAPKESDFTVLKLISQGAYGAVFLVKHNASKKRFAMKKISKYHALLKNQVRQIFAERDILSFTENPFVVSMFCSFETDIHFCMVMEYVEGGDCASLLKSVGQFSTEMAKIYIAETLVAVEYIHNYGITHKDIKPDNLLITSLGHIKLTDFGLSKIGLMNLTTQNSKDYLQAFHDKSIQGTPDYIAPEVILNKPYGKMVDYWSIGIVLYEFLVGCTPFYGKDVESLFEAIVNASIEWPEGEESLLDDAQSLISRLLDKNPITRLGSQNTDEVKKHSFFLHVEWNSLLQTKAEFIPALNSEEDTGNFDSREDRYDHSSSLENKDCSDITPKHLNKKVTELFTSSTRWFQQELEESKQSETLKSTTIDSSYGLSDNESNEPVPNNRLTRTEKSARKFGGTIPDTKSKGLNTSLYDIFASYNQTPSTEDSQGSTPSINIPRVSGLAKNIKYFKNSENQNQDEKKHIKITPLSRLHRTRDKYIYITLKKAPNSKNYGFAIRTIKVYVERKKLSFIQHVIDNVRKGSEADLAGVKQDYIILSINSKPLYNLQHVQVIRILASSESSINLEIASPQELGIFTKYRPFASYHMKEDSEYFKNLLASKTNFDLISSSPTSENSSLSKLNSPVMISDPNLLQTPTQLQIKRKSDKGQKFLSFKKTHNTSKEMKKSLPDEQTVLIYSSLPKDFVPKKPDFLTRIKKTFKIKGHSDVSNISPLVSESILSSCDTQHKTEIINASKSLIEKKTSPNQISGGIIYSDKDIYTISTPKIHEKTKKKHASDLKSHVSSFILKKTDDLENSINKK